MIRTAEVKDIPGILPIIEACALHMSKRGIHQWNEHYPSKKAFENDLERGELYVLELDSRIIGTIVISTKMDTEYIPITWLTPNQNNLYVHRLSIQPKYQGKGHARHLMDFAETFAREKGFLSVRLDTFSKNIGNQRFYEKRGYQKLGDIYFPKQSGHPFHCYELVL